MPPSGSTLDFGVIPQTKRLAVFMPDTDRLDDYLASFYKDQFGDPVQNSRRIVIALTHPLITLAALRYITHFPIVRVTVPKTERSRARWLFNVWRPWRLSGFVSSYIELPSPLQSFWQGTPKQNLRTRTSQALAAGLTVRAVTSPEINDVISQVFRDRGWESGAIAEDLRKRAQRKANESLEGAICVGVFDPNDHVVAFCIGTQAGDAILTLWTITSQKGAARWLCFSGFVKEASARGARFIIEEPPWTFTGGNKIFAGHLGFIPARIRNI